MLINPFFSSLVDVVEIRGDVLVVVINVFQVLHVVRVCAVARGMQTSQHIVVPNVQDVFHL